MKSISLARMYFYEANLRKQRLLDEEMTSALRTKLTIEYEDFAVKCISAFIASRRPDDLPF
jgi:hypothetical protein